MVATTEQLTRFYSLQCARMTANTTKNMAGAILHAIEGSTYLGMSSHGACITSPRTQQRLQQNEVTDLVRLLVDLRLSFVSDCYRLDEGQSGNHVPVSAGFETSK